MANWLFKLSQNVQIVVDSQRFNQQCNEQFLDLAYRDQDNRNQLKSFIPNVKFIESSLNTLGYPNTVKIIQTIVSKNYEQLLNDYLDLSNWSKSASLPYQQFDLLFKVSKELRNIMDQNDQFPFTEENAKQESERVIKLTDSNMNKIKTIISQAISRIPNWHSPLIRIVPNPSSEMYSSKSSYTTEATSAIVEFGTDDMAPNFTIFQDGEKIEIDDILEAGDSDFFHSSQTQSDYFNLIKEIQHPGSTQTGKLLKLYTARPKKDRELYLSGKVPSGIFLANNLNHVEGLAVDFGDRDIWKVFINSQYLINTLDSPEVKYYQVVGSGIIPVHKIELIS